ncbi:MAG: membrane protein insertase YidC [bacterium]|nr:membrane protein insertase YidC [bacterium]
MDRVQIAIIALAAVLIALALFNQPPPPPLTPPQPLPAATTQAPEPGRAPDTGLPPVPSQPGAIAEPDTPRQSIRPVSLVGLENDAVKISVSSLGGRIESIELSQFRDRLGDDAQPVQLVTGSGRATLVSFLGVGDEPLAGLESVEHEITSQGPRHIELRVVRDGVEVTRRISLDETGYGARLELALKNRGSAEVRPLFQLAFYGMERASDAPDHYMNYSVVALAEDGIERTAIRGIESPGFFSGLFGGNGTPGFEIPAPVEWTGIDSQYFLLAGIVENSRDASAYLGPLGRDLGQAVIRYAPIPVPPGTGVERSYRLYMGPKIAKHVAVVSPKLDPATVVGWVWVRPLVDLFAGLLNWTYTNIWGNYGVAIILLTILLRLLTFPLTQRSMKSMKRFSLIAPEMKAIQEKYADDRGKLQEELMKLYKQKGMNPLTAMGGGCIPMLIQMPFMIALYFALQSSIDLRHAPFAFWINDLSAPENLFAIGPVPLRILPLLMGGSMLLQQKLSPTPNADPQQKQMMMMMSVMFIFLFYQFPSGLVLYWFVSNLLGIAQQLFVNRSAPDPA